MCIYYRMAFFISAPINSYQALATHISPRPADSG